MKIKLVASGFFDWVFQNRDEHETRLKAMDAYPVTRKFPTRLCKHGKLAIH